MKKINVLGIPVTPGGVGDVPRLLSGKPEDKSLLVSFVNPQACALARQHDDYVHLLNTFDIVTCDGIGMVKAARISGLRDIKRESFDFTSLAGRVFQLAVHNQQRIGLVGGKPGVTIDAADVLRRIYPDIQVHACYSGYGQDPAEAQKFFTENQTDIVICGMGAPLQERFLVQLTRNGWHGIGFTCGGFLDQINAGESYYPRWIDRFNLRFLYRLGKEPRRLWRRYLIDYQVFIRRYCYLQWEIFKEKLGLTHYPGKNE